MSGPSIAGPSTARPSSNAAGKLPVGSSTAGPSTSSSTAGSSTAGPSTAGSSTAGSSIPGPSTVRQRFSRNGRLDSLQQLYPDPGPTQIPTSPTFPQWVVDGSGPPQDRGGLALTALAWSLFNIDMICVQMWADFLPMIQSGRLGVPQDVLMNAGRDALETMNYLEQHENLQNGGYHVKAKEYLENTQMIRYWRLAISMLRQFFSMDNSDPDDAPFFEKVRMTARMLERDAVALQDQIVLAAKHGLLEPEMQNMIWERWRRLDSLSIMFRQTYHEPTAPPQQWVELASRIDEAMTSAAISLSLRPSTPQPVPIPGNKERSQYLMWATIVVFIFFTLPLCAAAWNVLPKNSTNPTEQADFYFVLQNSAASCLNLFTMGVPIRNHGKPRSIARACTYGFMSLAVILMIVAPILYAQGLSEWSSMVTILVGAINAGFVLQLSIGASDNGEKVKTA